MYIKIAGGECCQRLLHTIAKKGVGLVITGAAENDVFKFIPRIQGFER